MKIFLDIDVNFHRLDEYSSSLLKKSQQQNAKKDTFSSVSILLLFMFVKLTIALSLIFYYFSHRQKLILT